VKIDILKFMLAKAEVQTGAQWLIQQAEMDFQDEEVLEKTDKTIITRYVPLGVTVGIVPWNCKPSNRIVLIIC
jgi:acyl-CoA reductase-like NAD-dependent aldehyde dehydrogenase